MKMINSTNIMSTMGVTLISEFKSLPPPEPPRSLIAMTYSSKMFFTTFGEYLPYSLTRTLLTRP
jgi:hypothetical protein